MGLGRTFAKKANAALPGDIRMISGCEDEQTSADVQNVKCFDLPDPAGRSGGACTSALLNLLYKDNQDQKIDLTFVELLTKMRENLEEMGFTQIPQLTGSNEIDLNEMFGFGGDGEGATKRAVLTGINYCGMQGELGGCHNDVLNIKEYLMDVHGFENENIVLLMDDDDHDPPTFENITNAFKNVVAETQEGDCVFIHYSGHGGKLKDDDWGEEEDGYDETLIPVDYMESGQIRDDYIYEHLVKPFPAGARMTCLMDCCHSGTVLDLPYKFKADGSSVKMTKDTVFKFGKLLSWLGLKESDISDNEEDSDEE